MRLIVIPNWACFNKPIAVYGTGREFVEQGRRSISRKLADVMEYKKTISLLYFVRSEFNSLLVAKNFLTTLLRQ